VTPIKTNPHHLATGAQRLDPPKERKLVLELYTPHVGQSEVHDCGARFRVVCCGRRWGKAISLDTPLPTPDGWTTMGEVEPGDVLFDETGTLCTVTAATQVQLGRPCFEVTFDDGSVIVADAEHEWLTYDKLTRKSLGRNPRISTHSPQVRTTEEIAHTLFYDRKDGAREHNHSIPVCSSLELPSRLLPVHPYILGAWLGDGTSVCAQITIGD
jgi:replicative DNA helicase